MLMATEKKEIKKTAKEVATPKKVPTTNHKLLKPYGKYKVGQVIQLGVNGVKELRKLKVIK